MTSLAAVAGLSEIPVRLVAFLGFGIDAYHGVNHVQVLENLAALDRDGGYLGALCIPGDSPSATLYRSAVAHGAWGCTSPCPFRPWQPVTSIWAAWRTRSACAR